MRLLFVALVTAVAACSFQLPGAVDPGPPAGDGPAGVPDAPAITPVDARPPVDMPPPPPPPPPDAPSGGQHCSNDFTLGTLHVSVECDRDGGTATCQCFREGVLEQTCTSFSLAPCNLPTCCAF